MRVTEIHFNHDTTSAHSDAINLRYNGHSAAITAPEWTDGGDSHPAAYAKGQIGGTVTIRVRFDGGPPNRQLNIRAVDGRRFSLNVLKFLFGTGNALGEVRSRPVNFDASGKSGLETFEITGRLGRLNTSATETTWIWQASPRLIGGSWSDFATTRHRIYVIPDLPTDPWTQDLREPRGRQLPWADALDHACLWAFATRNVNEAAEAITREINSRPQHEYCRDNQFVPGGTEFELHTYLQTLNLPDVSMNCRDAASVLVTFANLLGASLSPVVVKPAARLNNAAAAWFQTNEILLVGQDTWGGKSWGWHEIAMSGMLDPAGAFIEGLNVVGVNFVGGAHSSSMIVYDACLELNRAAQYVAVAMPLGESGAGGSGYRLALIQGGDIDLATVQGMRPVT